MTDAPRWRRYLRFWRSNVRADVDDEFAFHLQERIDDLVARGMNPKAARSEALRGFGDIEQLKGTCRTLAEEQETTMKRSEMLGVVPATWSAVLGTLPAASDAGGGPDRRSAKSSSPRNRPRVCQ